jgi:MoxR-like ATPase
MTSSNVSLSQLSTYWQQVRTILNEQVLGQSVLIDRLLMAVLANGHLLVEGAPGLAKTRVIKCLSQLMEGDFHRVQFTPDLLPSDLTGTDIFKPQDGCFTFEKGPIFHQLILADEINRAPAKVQSALLEAMEERQVTIGRKTYPLPPLFLVMATQNPIEQEGTFPLPEAQLDRFLMYVKIDYPNEAVERDILALSRQGERARPLQQILTNEMIMSSQSILNQMHMAPQLEAYLIRCIMMTRYSIRYDDALSKWIAYGASPRGTIALDKCARAHAFLDGRDYVTPLDVQSVLPDVLRHRILLTYEADMENISTDDCIARILSQIVSP